MDITMEKIELVKDRTGATYAEARAALEATDGSVVDAVIAIEENINKEFHEDSNNPLFQKVKDMGEKMDINTVVDKAKEVAGKGIELGKEAVDKASEYLNKETLTEAYDKAKEYAGVAVDKSKDLYKKGLDMAEEYQVKEKVESFIEKVGEKAEKINNAKAEAAANEGKIFAESEVISEEDEQ